MNNLDAKNDNYLKSLSSMHEDDFTRDIIKPLFEAMDYERVDFNGGPYERGRDLIAMKRIPPKKSLNVTLVQSKKIGGFKTTKDSAKISTLLHQLRQCCTGRIQTLSGDELYANNVFLACPEKISNRLIEEISSQLDYLRDKVEILDGPEIISLKPKKENC